MAAQGSVKDWFTFVGGLNTEGGYFNTPERNWVAGDNIVPKTDGSVERRNGIDFEEFSVQSTNTIDPILSENAAFTVGYWEDKIVVQHGYFLEMYTNVSGTISANSLPELTIDLRVYNPNTDFAHLFPVTGSKPCSYAVAYGRLIVTNAESNPIQVWIDEDENYNVEEIDIRIRDFKGIVTGKPIDEELTAAEWDAYSDSLSPSSLNGSSWATYNLQNQGWSTTQINAYKTANGDKLPSNTKSWIWGKDSNDDFQAALLNKQDFGSSPAPKGRKILNLFYQNRNLGSAGSFEEETIYRSRFTNTAFFAGRAWYSGAADEDLESNVYFSQVLSDITKLGKCYQENDPTSEIISDLLDNDGGVISIPDAGKILAMVPLGRGLLILASKGVYAVSGIDGVFSAANYQVEKVSDVGCIAPKSVVTVENSLLYWSNQGIYGLSLDQTGFSYSSQNISDAAIRTLYNEIPYTNKTLAQGEYNSTAKEIYWLYNDTFTTTNMYVKRKILSLNTVLQAWSTYSTPTADIAYTTPYVNTYLTNVFNTTENNTNTIEYTVVSTDGSTVTSNGGLTLTTERTNAVIGAQQFKFLTSTSYQNSTSAKHTLSPSNLTPITTFVASGGSLESAVEGPSQTRYVNGNNTELYQIRSAPYSAGGGLFFSTKRLYKIIYTKATPESTSVTFTSSFLDVGSNNVNHSGYTTSAFDFNLDGTRLYTSQIEAAASPTRKSRFGYYTLTTAYDITTTSGYTVLDTFTNGDLPINGIGFDEAVFSSMKITSRGMYTMRNSESFVYLRYFPTPSDGNPTSIAIPYQTQTFLEYNLMGNVKWNQFKFDPTGMGVYLTYNLSVVEADPTFTLTKFVPLSAPYNITSLTTTAINAVRNNQAYNTDTGTLPTFNDSSKIEGYYDMTASNGLNGNTLNVSISWPTEAFKTTVVGYKDQSPLNRVIGFADFNNTRNADTKFKDWYSVDNVGVDTEAYLVTGYQFADVGPARNKTGMYLTTYSKRTETGLDDEGLPVNPSSIKMQLRWDFTDDYVAGKWAVPVEVYRQPRAYLGTPGDITFEDGYPLVISKSKMRGRGKAVQFKFSSSDGYDMKLFGWTGTFVGNTNV